VDYQLKRASDNHAPLRRCLFSDGGISSNFPIHFFDDFLPRRPTFGITLGAWEEVRHGDTYVHLPEKSSVSTDFAVSEICSIPSFLFAILNTAKDWQDSMQSLLPGYADRIVSVRLDESSEGGMNLTMDSETIKKLSDHGREAGKKLVDDFDMDQHRWNRAMSLLPELEGAVARYSIAYRNRPTGSSPDESTYEEVLRDFGPKQFKNSRIWRDESLMPFAEGLARLGEIARQREEEPDQRSIRQGRVPWADSRIRLIAIANRVPK
jgi:hypothetical protein